MKSKDKLNRNVYKQSEMIPDNWQLIVVGPALRGAAAVVVIVGRGRGSGVPRHYGETTPQDERDERHERSYQQDEVFYSLWSNRNTSG